MRKTLFSLPIPSYWETGQFALLFVLLFSLSGIPLAKDNGNSLLSSKFPKEPVYGDINFDSTAKRFVRQSGFGVSSEKITMCSPEGECETQVLFDNEAGNIRDMNVRFDYRIGNGRTQADVWQSAFLDTQTLVVEEKGKRTVKQVNNYQWAPFDATHFTFMERTNRSFMLKYNVTPCSNGTWEVNLYTPHGQANANGRYASVCPAEDKVARVKNAIERGKDWDEQRNSDGTRTRTIYSMPANFWNGNSFVPINDTAKRIDALDEKYGEDYRIAFEGAQGIYFKTEINSEWPIAIEKNGTELRMKPFGLAYSDNGRLRYIQTASDSVGVPNKNAIVYENVFTGVDFHYYYEKNLLKEKIVLRDEFRTFMNSLRLDSNTTVYFVTQIDYGDLNPTTGGKALVDETKENIEFLDSNGRFGFSFLPAVAKDSSRAFIGKKEVPYPDVMKMPATVSEISGKTYYQASIPLYWLSRSTYPIEIDPTTQLDYTACAADIMATATGSSEIQMRWDLSSVESGQNILDVQFCDRILDNQGTMDTDSDFSRVDDQSWDSGIKAEDFDAQSLTNQTTSEEWSSINVDSDGCLNVTNAFIDDYLASNTYFSFRVQDPDYPYTDSTGAIDTDYLAFGNWKEGRDYVQIGKCADQYPKVDVTYEEAVSCTTITSSTKLTDNSGCIEFGNDNIYLDCAGYRVSGSGGTSSVGIAANGYSGITIRNCTVYNFGKDIEVSSGSNVRIYNNTLLDSTNGDGTGQLSLQSITGGIVENNTFKNANGSSQASMRLEGSTTRIRVYNNTMSDFNFEGILVNDNGYNNVTKNTFTVPSGAYLGVRVYSSNNIVENNTINGGNQLVSIAGGTGNTVRHNTGYTSRYTDYTGAYRLLSNTNYIYNNTVTGCVNGGAGIRMESVSWYNIENNSISNCSVCASLVTTTNTNFTNNTFSNCSQLAFNLTSGSNNIISLNTINLNKSRIGFGSSGTNNLTVKWYDRVNVTNSSGSGLQNAIANITDIYGTKRMITNTTDSGGLTGYVIVTEMYMNSTQNYTFNNHTINVSLTNYRMNSTSFNITGTTLNVTLYNSSCGTLVQNTTLIMDVSSAGTCFIIGADNVTLDCNGYRITYNTGDGDYRFGVISNYYNGTTVKNCLFSGPGSASIDYGIYLNNSKNSFVYNNSISSGADSSYGIGLSSTYNSSVHSNNISISSSESAGIRIDSSSYNNSIYSNSLTTYGYGINFYTGAHNNSVYLNNISVPYSGGMGINLNGVYNNSVYLNNITSSSSYTSVSGIYLTLSNWSLIYSNLVNVSGSGSKGLVLSLSHNNSVYSNRFISSAAASTSYGMSFIYGSSNNNLTNNNLTTSAASIYMDGTNGAIRDNLFANSTITNSSAVQVNSTSNAYNNVFLNMSFNKDLVAFGTSGTNNLTVKWYARVNVTKGDGAAQSGATVNVSDLFGAARIASQSTDANGLTAWATITEMYMNASQNYTFNNHTINASYGQGPINSTSFNVVGTVTYNITVYYSKCGTITSDTILINDLSTTETCIAFGAGSIYLDCNGHSITGDAGKEDTGVTTSGGYDDVTIRNCIINQFGINIYVKNAAGAYVYNNTLNKNAQNDGSGELEVLDGTNLIIANNTLSNSSDTYPALRIAGTSSAIEITNNTFMDCTGAGIRLDSQSNFNINDNAVGCSGCFYVGNSPDNNFTNNTLSCSDYHFALYDSSTNVISLNNTGLDKTKITYDPMANMWVKWYVRVNVTNASGAVSGADVNITDVNSNPVAQDLATDANGLTDYVILTEAYIDEGAGITSYNDHTFDAGEGSQFGTERLEVLGSWTINVTIAYPLPVLSFTITLPSSGCTNGKGCTTGGCSACTRAWIETTDLTGAANQVCVMPQGQTASIPFLNFTNTGNTNLNWTMKLNESFSSTFALNVSNGTNNCAGSTQITNTFGTTQAGIGAGSSAIGWVYGEFINAIYGNETRLINHTSVQS